MSLTDWHRLPVGTPVVLRRPGKEPIVGNILQCSRARFQIITATELHWERWPTASYVAHDEPTQLRWIDDRWRTVTLTIREEKPCTP